MIESDEIWFARIRAEGPQDALMHLKKYRYYVEQECANRAVEYVFFEGDDDPIDENGFQAPSISSSGLRVSIIGSEP
jgi:hypothetical protein